MCVVLMSILYSVETSSRSLTQLETYPQVSKEWLSDLINYTNQYRPRLNEIDSKVHTYLPAVSKVAVLPQLQ